MINYYFSIFILDIIYNFPGSLIYTYYELCIYFSAFYYYLETYLSVMLIHYKAIILKGVNILNYFNEAVPFCIKVYLTTFYLLFHTSNLLHQLNKIKQCIFIFIKANYIILYFRNVTFKLFQYCGPHRKASGKHPKSLILLSVCISPFIGVYV